MEKLERVRGDRYALSALKNKRAGIASEIVELERKLRHLRESLVHVDATILLLNPDANPEAIRTKRPVRNVKLFRQGELGRMIVDALRRAGGGPLSTRDIATAVMDAGGHDESARRALGPRVRGNLSYLHREKKVEKIGAGKVAAWRLIA